MLHKNTSSFRAVVNDFCHRNTLALELAISGQIEFKLTLFEESLYYHISLGRIDQIDVSLHSSAKVVLYNKAVITNCHRIPWPQRGFLTLGTH